MEGVFLNKYNAIYVKTFLRAVLGYAGIEVAANKLIQSGKDPTLVSFSAIGLKVTVDALGIADIRSSRYFPGKAYVGGITLDPGEYEVTVTYYSEGEPVETLTSTIDAQAGKVNLVEAVCLK